MGYGGAQLEAFAGRAFEASPQHTGRVWGNLSGQHEHHNWSFFSKFFTSQHIPRVLRGVGTSYVWCQGGSSFWGGFWDFKMHEKNKQKAQQCMVWTATKPALHDKHAKGLCASPMPDFLKTVHFAWCFDHIFSTCGVSLLELYTDLTSQRRSCCFSFAKKGHVSQNMVSLRGKPCSRPLFCWHVLGVLPS